MDKKEIYVLVFLIILLFAVNYPWLDGAAVKFFDDSDFVHVGRIIDGDTIIADNITIRLLGINTPERGEEFYSEAKEFLENEILNKTIQLKFGKDKKDLYNRTLAYVFLGNENVNLKLIKGGFGNFYFPSGKDNHYSEFKTAWENCIRENKNLCEKSQDICVECIKLKEFNSEKEEIVFYNSCDFSCDFTSWNVKDEGRKKFVFPDFILESRNDVKIIVSEENVNENKVLTWIRKDYVWTRTGDTLFLRDKNGKLILWENY